MSIGACVLNAGIVRVRERPMLNLSDLGQSRFGGGLPKPGHATDRYYHCRCADAGFAGTDQCAARHCRHVSWIAAFGSSRDGCDLRIWAGGGCTDQCRRADH